MHENVRICVERNRHSWSCPVKRLRSSGAERARAAISGAPAEPSGLERQCRAPQRSRAGSKSETSAGAVFSSSQAEQFRAPWRSRVSSSGHFERPSGAERARAAISSAPAEPSGLEVGNVGRCGVFEPGRAELSPGGRKACKRPCGDFEVYIYIFSHPRVLKRLGATEDATLSA